MLFALICKDKPGHLAGAPRHPARACRLSSNGLNAEGTLNSPAPSSTTTASRTAAWSWSRRPTLAAATAIADADPYAKAGLFDSVEIQPWNWVFNNPEA